MWQILRMDMQRAVRLGAVVHLPPVGQDAFAVAQVVGIEVMAVHFVAGLVEDEEIDVVDLGLVFDAVRRLGGDRQIGKGLRAEAEHQVHGFARRDIRPGERIDAGPCQQQDQEQSDADGSSHGLPPPYLNVYSDVLWSLPLQYLFSTRKLISTSSTP